VPGAKRGRDAEGGQHLHRVVGSESLATSLGADIYHVDDPASMPRSAFDEEIRIPQVQDASHRAIQEVAPARSGGSHPDVLETVSVVVQGSRVRRPRKALRPSAGIDLIEGTALTPCRILSDVHLPPAPRDGPVESPGAHHGCRCGRCRRRPSFADPDDGPVRHAQ